MVPNLTGMWLGFKETCVRCLDQCLACRRCSTKIRNYTLLEDWPGEVTYPLRASVSPSIERGAARMMEMTDGRRWAQGAARRRVWVKDSGASSSPRPAIFISLGLACARAYTFPGKQGVSQTANSSQLEESKGAVTEGLGFLEDLGPKQEFIQPPREKTYGRTAPWAPKIFLHF